MTYEDDVIRDINENIVYLGGRVHQLTEMLTYMKNIYQEDEDLKADDPSYRLVSKYDNSINEQLEKMTNLLKDLNKTKEKLPSE